MIRVIDGTLYQWGIDREIEILNPEIKKVAFANNHHCGDDPIDVVDGKVILPNKFLQSSQNIDVYGLDQDGNEIYSHQLEVNGKMKPSDYSVEIEGGGSGGKKLVFTHEVTDGNVKQAQISMKPLKDLIENDKNFVVEIVYEYYGLTYRASIGNYSGTVKKDATTCGFSGFCEDEWGENSFICGNENNSDTFTVFAEASGGTFVRFNIYELS